MFENLSNLVNEMNNELESLKNSYQEALSEVFKDGIKKFFLTFPEVQAIVWEQYTPYFNDGEECVFSVHEPVFITEGFDEENLESPSWAYQDEENYKTLYIPYGGGDTDLLRACYTLESTLNEMEEYLKIAFGDHATVYLTPNNIIVQEYCHD